MASYMYLSITGEGKIAIYEMNPESGGLTHKEDVAGGAGVMPLVVDTARQHLYAGLRGEPSVQTYSLDRNTGSLSLQGATPFDWDTTYMSLDNTGRFLLPASNGRAVAGVNAKRRSVLPCAALGHDLLLVNHIKDCPAHG